ncbi:MAG: alkaline phosphatase family protein [Steroidobacteraceae bacterium]
MGPERLSRFAAGFAAIFGSLALTTASAASDDRNIVLVTLDGVRIQELFTGMDRVIAGAPEAESGVYEIDITRARYWRDSAVERREALMPFLWKTLAPAGMVLGNQALGSKVTVRNDQWFSYPGYSEILTGEPQPEIKSNDFVRYPHETVLDFVHRELKLKPTEVAQIGSWDGFKFAASRNDGAFFMNGAYDLVPPALSTPEMELLGGLRRQVMQLWEESSNDVLTFRIALAYLKKHRPRVLWLGLGQSDDWAHARRYDRLLDYLHLVDGLIGELWRTLQSLDSYRGRTTLIITTDHGRGRGPADWAEHDAGIEGSQDIWIAIIGPDTPALGEARNFPHVTQSDVAATMLQYLGLDYRKFNPDAGPPIRGSLEAR